jgi:hypothetical protein
MDSPNDFGGDVLAAAADGIARRRADHRFASEGLVRCSLLVIEGRQDGLVDRWRSGIAAVSPGRLDFRPPWWRGRGKVPSLQVMAVLGPARLPSAEERLKLPGGVVRIQTRTAILEWSLPGRYRSAAITRLEVPNLNPPAETEG